MDAGLTDLYHAQKARMTEEHDVIDQAVKDRGKGYSVFSIPPLVLFRPPENRLRQLQGVDMFAVVDQLQITKKPINTTIARNNSILLSEKMMIKKQQQQQMKPSPLSSSPRTTTNSSNSRMYQSDDSASTASFSSSYKTKQSRVDSGFESTLEDRYSSSSSIGIISSRNSGKSFKGSNQFNPPPVPPIPKSHTATIEEDNYYGDFDQELDEVYGSLHDLSVQDKEKDLIKNRLANGKAEDLRIQASSSTSTIGSNNSGNYSGKIKIKIHFVDTRILLVSNSISFDELKFRVRDKFGAPPSIRLQYKDEDNEMVLMIDDDDLFMARQVNKSNNNNSSDLEKIEIWCVAS
jgi:hypothetical protein